MLAASFTAILLGGWLLLLMRQVSPHPDLRTLSGSSRGNSAPPSDATQQLPPSPAPTAPLPSPQELPQLPRLCSVRSGCGIRGIRDHRRPIMVQAWLGLSSLKPSCCSSSWRRSSPKCPRHLQALLTSHRMPRSSPWGPSHGARRAFETSQNKSSHPVTLKVSLGEPCRWSQGQRRGRGRCNLISKSLY
jgi:hypothetical protein